MLSAAAILVYAHAGHWFAGLLYVAPVVVIVVALWVQGRREKRGARADDDDAAQP